MNPTHTLPYALRFGLTFALLGPALAALAAPRETAATNAAPASLEPEIPRSVFVIPASPREGRNPFFPESTRKTPVPKTAATAADLSTLTINGITSPPKRTVMINYRTFEIGEEGEVKLPNGASVLVKCENITDDSTTILVDGHRRILRLPFGL